MRPYVTVNLAPVGDPPNGAATTYLLSRGARPVLIVGDAELNRSCVWGDPATGLPRPNVLGSDGVLYPGVDWGQAADRSSPPQEAAVRLNARLALDPSHYAFAGTPAGLVGPVPLMVDVENLTVDTPPDGDGVRLKALALRWCREAAPQSPRGCFWMPPPFAHVPADQWRKTGMDELAAEASYVAACGYTLIGHVLLGADGKPTGAIDSDLWDAHLAQWVEMCRAKCPDKPLWVVVNPGYQIQAGPTHPLWPLHDTPIPLDEWRRQLARIKAVGGEAVAWVPTLGAPLERWRPYLDAVLESDPMPDADPADKPQTVADLLAAADAAIEAEAAGDRAVAGQIAAIDKAVAALQAKRAQLAATLDAPAADTVPGH